MDDVGEFRYAGRVLDDIGSPGAPERHTITAPSPGENAHFGASVAIRRDGALIVGAPGVGKSSLLSPTSGTGAAFFTHLSGGSWSENIREIDTISALANKNDQVGYDVAIGDSALYVGAPKTGNGDGAVYAINMCTRELSDAPCAAHNEE